MMEEEQKVPNTNGTNQFYPEQRHQANEQDEANNNNHFSEVESIRRVNIPDDLDYGQDHEVVFEDDRDRSPMAQRGLDDENSPAVAARSFSLNQEE